MADFTYQGGGVAPVSGGGAGNMASAVHWAGALASLALIVGAGIWSYGVLARDVSGVPVVQAASGPMRVAPVDPGGTMADHQGLAVNAVAGQGAAEGPVDRLVLAPRPAGLAAEDVAVGALTAREAPPMQASLAREAEIVELTPDVPLLAEDDPVMALVEQLAAETAPLTPLAPGEDSPVVTEVQDVAGAEADAVAEAVAETETPPPGPGLARSLRPVLRPAGLQTASLDSGLRSDASAPTASVTQEIDPASLVPGTRLVQIGAYDSPETARSEWRRLETRFGEFLEGKARVIQQASSGGRTFYRLRAHGFADLSDARRFCATFVSQNVDCIPVVTR